MKRENKAVTCDMRTEQETARRAFALVRFRLPFLSITPDAGKNVWEIVGKQKFEKTDKYFFEK